MSEFIHPRVSKPIHGHDRAESTFLEAFNSNRLHHAWLLSGCHGLGKATLAYRVAKFLLSSPKGEQENLNSICEVSAKVLGLSHPDLLVLETGREGEDGKEVKEIKVDDVRKVAEFLSLTPAESKYRVVIIDSADQMNINAANALLKLLEEPPANAILLLVCHSVGKILPTIRSRCRMLKLEKLSEEDFSNALARLFPEIQNSQELYLISEGSVGVAAEIYVDETLDLYKRVESLFAGKRTQKQILEIASLASDEKNWKIISYALLKIMSDKVVNEASAQSEGIESKLDFIAKAQEMIANANRAHLDKTQVVTALLS